MLAMDQDLLSLAALGRRGRPESVSIPANAETNFWTAGRILGVDSHWLKAECEAGRLPFTEHNGLTFYPIPLLQAAIKNLRTRAARRPGRYRAPPPFDWRLDLAAKLRQQAHRLSNFNVPTWKQRIDTKRRLIDLKDEDAGLPAWQIGLLERRRESDDKLRNDGSFGQIQKALAWREDLDRKRRELEARLR